MPPAPRPLRPTPKAQRTREAILDASLTLFRERGFDQASLADIARQAGISVGSTYYYFRSKDELVLAFYEQTQAGAAERNLETIASTTRFEARLRDLLEFKLSQLAPYRGFIVVLARNAVEPTNPLSPFSGETRSLREAAIELLEQAITGSDLKVHEKLRPQLPRLLWLYQMGIIFFWIHDPSRGQQRSRLLLDQSLKLVLGLLRLSTLPVPGLGRLVGQVVDLLDLVGGTLHAR